MLLCIAESPRPLHYRCLLQSTPWPTTSHTKYDLKYHLVWITKYRPTQHRPAVGTRVRELVREICRTNDIEIVKGHVGKDHVHLFVSVPPYLSVSKVMQYLKGKTSHKLLIEFAHLRRPIYLHMDVLPQGFA